MYVMHKIEEIINKLWISPLEKLWNSKTINIVNILSTYMNKKHMFIHIIHSQICNITVINIWFQIVYNTHITTSGSLLQLCYKSWDRLTTRTISVILLWRYDYLAYFLRFIINATNIRHMYNAEYEPTRL